MSSKIPRGPLQILQDNIVFEDILGRVHSLQYQHFQYLEVFEAMLRSTFKGKPGANVVLGGQYHILNAVNHSLIPREKWGDKVFPGTKIVMSAIFASLEVSPGFCPRVGCEGRFGIAKTAKQVKCPVCSLIIYSSHQNDSPLAENWEIDNDYTHNQRHTVHEIEQEPWWRRLHNDKIREEPQSGGDRSRGLDSGQTIDHDPSTTGPATGRTAQSAGHAMELPLGGHDGLDIKLQEIDVYRRIHLQSVNTLNFAETNVLYSIGSTVYTFEDRQWRAYQVYWKGRVKELDLQIHCTYFSHNETGTSLHARYSSFFLPAFQGRKKVTDLPLIPAVMLASEEVLLQGLIERGWQYWNLGRSVHCLECVGEASEGLSRVSKRFLMGDSLPTYSKERVVVDTLEYHKFRSTFHEEHHVNSPIRDCHCIRCSVSQSWASTRIRVLLIWVRISEPGSMAISLASMTKAGMRETLANLLSLHFALTPNLINGCYTVRPAWVHFH